MWDNKHKLMQCKTTLLLSRVGSGSSPSSSCLFACTDPVGSRTDFLQGHGSVQVVLHPAEPRTQNKASAVQSKFPYKGEAGAWLTFVSPRHWVGSLRDLRDWKRNHLEDDAGCLLPAASVAYLGSVKSESQGHPQRARRSLQGLTNSRLSYRPPLLSFKSLLEPTLLLLHRPGRAFVPGAPALPLRSFPAVLALWNQSSRWPCRAAPAPAQRLPRRGRFP